MAADGPGGIAGVGLLRVGLVVVNVPPPPEMVGTPDDVRLVLRWLLIRNALPPMVSPMISSTNTIQPMRMPGVDGDVGGGGIGAL